MLEIEKLSKDSLYNIMAEEMRSLNYAGFLLLNWVKVKHPEEFVSEEFSKVYKDAGSYEAKRLSKALGLPGKGIDSLIELLKHSHWAVFENIELDKITETSFTMRTIDCSTQRAAKGMGADHHDCRSIGLLQRTSFLRAVNSQINVQRIFSPPEPRPEGTPTSVSCQWLISIT